MGFAISENAIRPVIATYIDKRLAIGSSLLGIGVPSMPDGPSCDESKSAGAADTRPDRPGRTEAEAMVPQLGGSSIQPMASPGLKGDGLRPFGMIYRERPLAFMPHAPSSDGHNAIGIFPGSFADS